MYGEEEEEEEENSRGGGWCCVYVGIMAICWSEGSKGKRASDHERKGEACPFYKGTRREVPRLRRSFVCDPFHRHTHEREGERCGGSRDRGCKEIDELDRRGTVKHVGCSATHVIPRRSDRPGPPGDV
jgi:hypothetical protein